MENTTKNIKIVIGAGLAIGAVVGLCLGLRAVKNGSFQSGAKYIFPFVGAAIGGMGGIMVTKMTMKPKWEDKSPGN